MIQSSDINIELNEADISAECIGKLIDAWIVGYERHNHTANNCQFQGKTGR